MTLILNPTRSLICALALLFLLFAPSVFAGPSIDNSQNNRQDYNAAGEKRKLTPEDQSWGTSADVEMTRRIREELMREGSSKSKMITSRHTSRGNL